MDAVKAILTRRSIRKYTKEKIPMEIIRELIEAAVSAPSAGNQQLWQFIVIDDKNIMNKVPDFHPQAKLIQGADKAILISGDLNLEIAKGYWVLDCGAATQNLLLAAHAKGLGACWLGIYPRDKRVEEIRKLLNIPESVVPFSLVALGYPAEEKGKVERYNEERVHYNKW